MENKKGFFQENKGENSMVRLQMFLTLLFAFFAIGWQVFSNKVNLEFVIILLLFATMPKLVQKFLEKYKDIK